jgi:putative FmdB family regulatory protein
MPLYEYECKKCHHRFEKIQKFSDPHMKKCPDCRGPVALVISAPAVQFKGSGWYVTDYPKKSSSGTSSSDSESSKDSASKDSASKDSGSKDSGSKDSAKDSASKKDGKSKESKTESKSSTTRAEKN